MPEIFENIRNGLRELSTRQKIQLGAAVLATLGLVWGVTQYATRVRYGTLFPRLDTEDAAEVVEALKDRNVPYRVVRGGRAVEVPVPLIDELRMELAGEGLPRGGGVGFEIFDKPAFGISDFVQNVNFRRALERELGRSIQSLETVDTARVHLALPEESVFADDKKEASASVVVRLRGGGALSSERVQAIAHLVSSGVEGLAPERVSVIDHKGRMLTTRDDESGQALSSTQTERKQEAERQIELALIEILEPVVGVGKARVQANVELETARVERVEETFDPDGAVVRSEQKNRSKSSGGAGGAGGVPGAASNLPGGKQAAAGPTGGDETQSTITNFEINKSVARIDEPRGKLLRQSIAVVVDHAGADPNDPDTTATGTPRTAEEMERITKLVRATVMLDETRGDFLSVENVAFDQSVTPVDIGGGFDWIALAMHVLRYGSVPLAVLLIALFVVRPGIAALRAMAPEPEPEERADEESGPPTVAQLQERIARASLDPADEGGGLRHKLIEAAATDPRAAALVVRGWLETESR